MELALELIRGCSIQKLEHIGLFKAYEIIQRSKQRPFELPRIFRYPLSFDELQERNDAYQLMKWKIDCPKRIEKYLDSHYPIWKNI